MTIVPVGFVGFVGVPLTRIQKSVTYYSACRDTSWNLSRKEPTNPTKPTNRPIFCKEVMYAWKLKGNSVAGDRDQDCSTRTDAIFAGRTPERTQVLPQSGSLSVGQHSWPSAYWFISGDQGFVNEKCSHVCS